MIQPESSNAARVGRKAASVEPIIKAYTVTHDALQPGSTSDIASIHTPSAQNGTEQQRGHVAVLYYTFISMAPTWTGPTLAATFPYRFGELLAQRHEAIVQPRSF